MIVSQSSKKDSDSRALSMRDATLYRRLVAKLNYLAMDRPDIRCAASTMGSQASSPKDVDMVRFKKSGAISDWATNHLDALSMGGCDQTESWHTRTVIGQQTAKTGVQRVEGCLSTMEGS